MANSGSRCNYAPNRSVPPADPPHFFKIIHSGLCQDKLLRIPPKFAMKYGRKLSNPLFLNVPNGAMWEVELIKSGKELWFSNGWKQFKDYYSICHGHLLVFRYERNSQFHVLIFDMSASEIEYSSFTAQGAENNLKEETEDTTEMEHEIKLECDMGMRAAPVDLKVPRKQPGTSKHKSEALQKSKGFKSKYPYCVVLMKLSHVSPKQTGHIPTWFGREYLGKRSREVLLKMSGSSRKWSVKCHCSVFGALRYSLRWLSFVRDNKIKAGDVCAFELIESSEPVFNVTVFRA